MLPACVVPKHKPVIAYATPLRSTLRDVPHRLSKMPTVTNVKFGTLQRITTLVVCIVIALASINARAAEQKSPTVQIESGVISGNWSSAHDVQVYKGIAFAAPPVGNLRWKPPQPAKKWDGIRACSEYGPACPQPKVFIISDDINNLYEDCLNLNVWAPAKHASKQYPVMVWIHGGAYVLGANCQRLFDGEPLARIGVVVVTINYRLGPFGFMAHPLLSRESEHGVSGNYGLLDQLAAARVGAAQHSGLRRRSRLRHDIWRIGRGGKCLPFTGLAAIERALTSCHR